MEKDDALAEPDLDDLRQLLEEAELRKDAQNRKVGGRLSLVVCIPILLLLAWAVIFLIRYDNETPPGEGTPANTSGLAPTTPSALTDEQKDMAQYDMFRDEKDRVIKTNALGLEKTSDKMIDKDDIRFAMELLNFMQPQPDPKPKPAGH